MVDRRSVWLAGALVGAACRGQLAAPPADPPRLVDGVPIAGWHRSDDRDEIADDVAGRHALVDRHIAELVAGVRRLYPIDDPACSLPLPRGS